MGQEELNILENPETYISRPNEAWKGLRPAQIRASFRNWAVGES